MLLSDVWRMSVWRLSVAYIGPKSRTERPRKTKIGREVAHVTRDSDPTFKVKRSKVKVTRSLCSPLCWRARRLQRWALERVDRGETAATLPSARRRKALRRPRGGEGWGISWRPPAYSLFTWGCCQISHRALHILIARPFTAWFDVSFLWTNKVMIMMMMMIFCTSVILWCLLLLLLWSESSSLLLFSQ